MLAIRILLLILCPLTLSATHVSAQDTWFPVVEVSSGVFVATDTLPDDIETVTLAELYAYLRTHVTADPTGDFYAWVENPPRVLIRFVSPRVRMPFPHGTESYGGMSGWADWQCISSTGLCRLIDAHDTPDSDLIVILVATTSRRAENLGLVAHELSHLFGSIDGARYPAHPSYHPGQVLPPDPADAYWWYGVTGIFDLVPCGIVWQALNDQCVASDAPDICLALQQMLLPS